MIFRASSTSSRPLTMPRWSSLEIGILNDIYHRRGISSRMVPCIVCLGVPIVSRIRYRVHVVSTSRCGTQGHQSGGLFSGGNSRSMVAKAFAIRMLQDPTSYEELLLCTSVSVKRASLEPLPRSEVRHSAKTCDVYALAPGGERESVVVDL